jgi:hypothetical protein
MKSIFIFLVSSLLSQSLFATDEAFSKESKIHWRVEISKNNELNKYEADEIDGLVSEGIFHKKLKIKCQMELQREHIKYDPSGKNGYTRDEERVHTSCKYKKSKIKLETVTCARGYGKKGVGTIYGDKTSIEISKKNRSFALKIICTRK